MEVVELDAQLLTSVEIIDKAVVCLLSFVLVRLREIDKVGAVGESVFIGVIVVLFALADEAVLGFCCDRWIAPFALGFKEKGERVGADLNGICDGILDAYLK